MAQVYPQTHCLGCNRRSKAALCKRYRERVGTKLKNKKK